MLISVDHTDRTALALFRVVLQSHRRKRYKPNRCRHRCCKSDMRIHRNVNSVEATMIASPVIGPLGDIVKKQAQESVAGSERDHQTITQTRLSESVSEEYRRLT